MSKQNGTTNQRFYPRNDVFNAGRKGQERNNLPSYYYSDPIIADEISRFSFNKTIGVSSVYESETPGFMRITMNPSVGVTPVPNGYYPSTRAYDAPINKGINAAARKIWFNLTSKTGRSASYSKTDVSCYICALGSLIGLNEHMRRIFGVTNLYSVRNRLFLYKLLEALGVEPNDFLANIANYRKRFNKLIAILNGFPIPASIDFFAKEQELYQKIYKDAESSMCQYYFFAPSSVWELDEESYEGGTILKTRPIFHDTHNTDELTEAFIGNYAGEYVSEPVSHYYEYVSPTTSQTFGSLLNLFESMLNKIADSSTMSMICADLLNLAANGGTSFWTFDTCPDDYWIEPEMNPYVMLQIHNMMAVGTPYGMRRTAFQAYLTAHVNDEYKVKYMFGTPSNDVYTDVATDTLVYNPSFKYTSNGTALGIPYSTNPIYIFGDIIVDSLTGAPTTDDRIEMTRYLVGNSYESDLKESINFFNHSKSTMAKGFILKNWVLPDHYPVTFTMFTASKYYAYTSIGDPDTVMFSVARGGTASENLIATISDIPQMASRFDWAPPVRKGIVTAGKGRSDVIGSLNYFTSLTSQWLEDVNDLAYIAIFDLFKSRGRGTGGPTRNSASSTSNKRGGRSSSEKKDWIKNPKDGK